ncbi:MAG: NADH-quinone oxidoreductase subunit C [Chloroflexi bacterium]|nr:NADH-quinone oxidoreductase subunit C [Chloroflexota bacterium]
MTRLLAGQDIAHQIEQKYPEAVVDAQPEFAMVKADKLIDVCTFLRDGDLDFKFLNSLTAVDRLDAFEIVYHMTSISLNQMGSIKISTSEREKPVFPSVTSVWPGAHLQEREAYDLMGIVFEGHPDLRRIFLWEGFAGWPLRKDYLNMPGHMAGLERFPGEPGKKLEGRGNVDA